MTGLSLAWIALVALYLGWGAIQERGLYRWLAELQLDRFGAYYPGWTFILPVLVLALPALLLLRRREGEWVEQLPGPAGEAQRGARVARIVAAIGLVAALVGAGSYLMAQRLPDGSEPATPVEIATLGQGVTPTTRVSVRGTPDEAASTLASEIGRNVDENDLYVAFRPESGGKDAPVRLFVARRIGSSNQRGTAQYFMAEQSGYLVENGLPLPALRYLQSRGIAIATPHFVLRPGDTTRRDPYYVVAALSGLIAIACLMVALIGGLQARAQSRSSG
jgi:hypothetical protein